MNPARIVFPGFWFGKSDVTEAERLARLGVGGFCVYGGTAQQTREFTNRMKQASPYGQLLFCADIKDDLSEVIVDAPALPPNFALSGFSKPQDAAYRKGNLMGRMARACGIDWLLAPVVDLGYVSPSFGDEPYTITRLAGDMMAGISNAGALNCIKYFPGVSGVLKTLPQMEDSEFVPYKHLFRRSDAVMPSDMIFPNIDNDNQAMLSDKVVMGLLRKRLNYKGCVVSFPLFKGRLRYEEACAVKMIHGGVENVLAPNHAGKVVEAVEREAAKGLLTDKIIHAISNHEMFISKVQMGPEPDSIETAFELARHAFNEPNE
ncbi:MAG: hypothetical protein IKO35_06895 [Elusimicrobiaceae bacterium]|nr:hypothetical protein [Elusimicrobiaceae bacterium]